MPSLTKRYVESLKPRDKDYIVFDAKLPGFGVRVMPTGRLTYLIQYRAGGRTRRVKLGLHGPLTADQARSNAKEHLGAVAGGDNPAQEISEHRTAPTVGTVCERFYREHVLERCKPSTQKEYRRVIDIFIKPAIGAFKIVDVSRADISALHHKHRGIPYQANRNLGVLSKMFNLSEVWGLRPDGSNPCRHVMKYKETKRERFLSPDELQRLGNVLAECEADGSETPYVVAAYRLLLLTGCRLSEIQFLRWSYVRDGYLMLPDSKTGARRIPVPPAAQEIFDNLIRAPNNEFVIAGAIEGQHVTDLQKPWRRIRELAELDGVRIHDLRHTYASNAVMGGVPLPTVARLLGHSQIQTTMRYAHLADEPVRDAAAMISDELSQALTRNYPRGDGNVIAFPK